MAVSAVLPMVACARRADVPAGYVIPLPVRPVPCAGCGAEVLLSPSSAEAVRDIGAQPVCNPCAEAELRRRLAAGRAVAVGNTEAQEREYQALCRQKDVN